ERLLCSEPLGVLRKRLCSDADSLDFEARFAKLIFRGMQQLQRICHLRSVRGAIKPDECRYGTNFGLCRRTRTCDRALTDTERRKKQYNEKYKCESPGHVREISAAILHAYCRSSAALQFFTSMACTSSGTRVNSRP